MEFHEKLQELRKSRNLTQEELAEALYVSRTAVSKWESGRGYPSIDSLKEISAYFSISIDDLLSGEKLILIAEKENRTNIRKMGDRLFGMADLFSLLMILLPLYPKTIDGFVYSVNLWMYTETAVYNRVIYWILFLALAGCGAWKLFQVQRNLETEKKKRTVTGVSFGLSIATVFYLVLAREAYAAVLAVLLMLFKGFLAFKCIKANNF